MADGNGTLAAATPAAVRPLGSGLARAAAAVSSGQAGGAAGGLSGVKGEENGEAEGDEDELAPRRSILDVTPAWLISLIFHLIVLLALALIVSPVGEGLNDLMLTIGQSDQNSEGEFATFEIGEDTEVIDPSETLALESLATVDLFEMAEVTMEPEFPALKTIEKGLGPEILPISSMFVGRSGAMRQTLLSIYGGTKETEDAVELGLRWLVRQQGRDGSWSLKGPYGDGASGENRVAATAMALLAFLGAGHTHQEGDHSRVVQRGVRWLLQQQDREGFFANEGSSHQRTYAQAQSSIVVCELYGMTEDSWLRDAAQGALKYAEKAQGKDGGWRYNPGDAGDTSVTGWYVMALQSGIAAGLEVDQSTLYKVRGFMDTVMDSDGVRYSYQPRGSPSATMTAEGLLCRQYLGWQPTEPGLIQGANMLVEPNWIFKRQDPNVYYWYYATQVLHHYGGSPWRVWNDVMREELPAMQVKQGREAGSWAPQKDRWASVSGGRLMMTCFSIYCLEVYYRHMPLYQKLD